MSSLPIRLLTLFGAVGGLKAVPATVCRNAVTDAAVELGLLVFISTWFQYLGDGA